MEADERGRGLGGGGCDIGFGKEEEGNVDRGRDVIESVIIGMCTYIMYVYI